MTTLTLEEAGRLLASLAEQALRGEPVFIQVGDEADVLSLSKVTPELPVNYLADCYGAEEIALENHLAGLAPRGTAT